MKLKCYINGNEYDVVQGATFSEEYNETLDSASIIIDQVRKITDLRPYDDAYIYSVGEDDNEFVGYRNTTQQLLTFNSIVDVDNKKIKINAGDMLEIFSNTEPSALQQNIELVYKKVDGIKQSVNATFTYQQQYDFFNMTFRIDLYGYTFTAYREGAYYVIDYSGTFETFNNETFEFEVMTFGYVKVRKNWLPLDMPSFYKHLLIYQYTEERINPNSNIYKYKIELCSETKKLEVIQLPNISITQPLNIDLKRSVYDYATQFLSLYNPKIKMRTSFGSRQWLYVDKYILSPDIQEIFSDVYCPDFSLDNPSLKDVFHQLFLTKDRIPFVKDDVIYAMDITQRHGTFNTNGIYSIVGNMTLDNFADNLKRTYQDALSGLKTAKRTEYLGFRNSDVSLMTLGNMRLETKYPIYKINRILMCYYKKCEIYKLVDGNKQVVDHKIFLCKQDITPLVKLEQERALLSEDWTGQTDGNIPSGSDCVEEMARYKLYTVGYNIGGKTIEGWGTSYSYPKGWFDIEKTYIENIFDILDRNYQFGIYTYGYVAQKLNEGEIITTDYASEPLDNVISPFRSGASKLKSFIFEVEYEAFYNGTTITSKDGARDDITINDNSSSSLTLLEKDGLFQKEKANRFGNMAYSMMANYNTIDELQELGSVYDDDVIIYSRQYQIWNNIIKASYSATKDYVLKNYFTSVYAKHRPFALMDYSQSTNRAENRKMYVMLSKENLYFENANDTSIKLPLQFSKFNNGNYLEKLISFASPNQQVESIDAFVFDDKINFGFIEHQKTINNGGIITTTTERYATDLNTFTNGYSLCFNVAMKDNITMGNYIEKANPDFDDGITDVEDDYTGSIQNFYGVIDSSETGFTEKLGIYVSNIPKNTFDDMVFEDISSASVIWNKLLALPKITQYTNEQDIIGGEYYLYKDNKEVIDMTFQIEPFTTDENIVFSEWLLKLSDLNGVYNKVSETYICNDVDGWSLNLNMYCSSLRKGAFGTWTGYPMFIIEIPKNVFNSLQQGRDVIAYYIMDRDRMPSIDDEWFTWTVIRYEIRFRKIESISQNQVRFNCVEILTYRKGLLGGTTKRTRDVIRTFDATTSIRGLTLDTTNNYYFNNFEFDGIWNIRGDSGFPVNNGYNCVGNKLIVQAGTGDLSFNDFEDTEMSVSTPSQVGQVYEKNMFILLDDNPIRKTLVYDEFKIGDLNFSNLRVDETIKTMTSETTGELLNENYSYIYIDLTNVDNTTKSLQVWFNDDGTLHFVFGVNLSEEDFENGFVKIYLSNVSKKDTRVYSFNHLIVGKTRNFVDELENYGFTQYYDVITPQN